MRFKRRAFSIFTLSFLDVMCCGFGAVVLLFMILKHEAITRDAPAHPQQRVEIARLQEALKTAQAAAAASTLEAAALAREITTLHEETAAIQATLQVPRTSNSSAITAQDVAALRVSVQELELQQKKLLADHGDRAQQARHFDGDGEREYLTGIKTNGKRTLILLDTSASMLDEKIINIIRRRNMDDDTKRRAEKWQQALDTVDWISARLVPGTQYQIYTFGEDVQAALTGTDGHWLSTVEHAQFKHALHTVRQLLPAGGSNLAKAMQLIRTLQPPPDNVFLITDSLPTKGLSGATRRSVSGEQRIHYFEEARSQIPDGIPLNVVLLPIEGDPMAPWAYWELAVMSHGAFISPAYDWP